MGALVVVVVVVVVVVAVVVVAVAAPAVVVEGKWRGWLSYRMGSRGKKDPEDARDGCVENKPLMLLLVKAVAVSGGENGVPFCCG